MKNYLAIISCVFVLGCGEFEQSTNEPGPRGTPGTDGKDGTSSEPCTVDTFEDGVTITCPDGSVAEIYHGDKGEQGVAGNDGENGIDGEDGKNATPSQPIYIGYFCSRTVLKINKTHYIINGNLIPLTTKWLKVHNTCDVRLKSGKVETK